MFVVAEREYETRKTLPEFARNVLGARHGLRYTFLHVNPGDPWDIPGLEVLDDADALVLSVRRRALPEKQLAAIRRYLEAGKPLVAIRTSSHAFDTRGAVRERPGYADWPAFDTEVLGGDYEGHHRGQDASESTFVWRLDAARSHPILRGVSPGELKVRSWLYKTRPLAETATPLMMGRAGDRKPHQPVAWTNTYRGGRIFYTSLGHPDDFRDKTFQRLLANAVLWALEREVPGPAR
ncbi:MAG: ThuA domain-containing protein [Planctomycetota bacterium]|nr:ThuA domain-containing protein [Planctomycetota bacterium]